MITEKFKYENVLLDGTFKDERGAVHVDGKILMSEENGGCDLEHCNCSKGHWITIVQPRTNEGIVEGVRVTFNDKKEMINYLNSCEDKINNLLNKQES